MIIIKQRNPKFFVFLFMEPAVVLLCSFCCVTHLYGSIAIEQLAVGRGRLAVENSKIRNQYTQVSYTFKV